MKLGVANRISVSDFDTADTIDVSPKYCDCVYIFQAECPHADKVAQQWLNHLDAE